MSDDDELEWPVDPTKAACLRHGPMVPWDYYDDTDYVCSEQGSTTDDGTAEGSGWELDSDEAKELKDPSPDTLVLAGNWYEWDSEVEWEPKTMIGRPDGVTGPPPVYEPLPFVKYGDEREPLDSGDEGDDDDDDGGKLMQGEGDHDGDDDDKLTPGGGDDDGQSDDKLTQGGGDHDGDDDAKLTPGGGDNDGDGDDKLTPDGGDNDGDDDDKLTPSGGGSNGDGVDKLTPDGGDHDGDDDDKLTPGGGDHAVDDCGKLTPDGDDQDGGEHVTPGGDEPVGSDSDCLNNGMVTKRRDVGVNLTGVDDDSGSDSGSELNFRVQRANKTRTNETRANKRRAVQKIDSRVEKKSKQIKKLKKLHYTLVITRCKSARFDGGQWKPGQRCMYCSCEKMEWMGHCRGCWNFVCHTHQSDHMKYCKYDRICDTLKV
jgi:hypothetical protein